jgi:hypothetical protein
MFGGGRFGNEESAAEQVRCRHLRFRFMSHRLLNLALSGDAALPVPVAELQALVDNARLCFLAARSTLATVRH